MSPSSCSPPITPVIFAIGPLFLGCVALVQFRVAALHAKGNAVDVEFKPFNMRINPVDQIKALVANHKFWWGGYRAANDRLVSNLMRVLYGLQVLMALVFGLIVAAALGILPYNSTSLLRCLT